MCVWIMKGTRLKTYDRSRSIRAPPWQRNLLAKAQLSETKALAAVEAQGDDEEVEGLMATATEAMRHFHVHSHVHRY